MALSISIITSGCQKEEKETLSFKAIKITADDIEDLAPCPKNLGWFCQCYTEKIMTEINDEKAMNDNWLRLESAIKSETFDLPDVETDEIFANEINKKKVILFSISWSASDYCIINASP